MALDRSGMRSQALFRRIVGQTVVHCLCYLALFSCGIAVAQSNKLSAWEIRKGDTTVYVVGSVHSLRESDYPLPPLFDQLASQSSQIVFELLQDDLNSANTTRLVQQLGLYPNGTGIYDEISRDTYAQLQAYLIDNNLPLDFFDRSRPWLASGEIDNREAAKAGFKSELGVEQHFYRLASTQQKKVRALETAEFQIRLFAETSPADQESQLRASFTRMKENVQQLIELVGHYKRGDVQAMSQLINAAEDPASYARFFTDRNRNWAAQIELFLEQGENSLVVAGVGHFVGSENVIEKLQQKGFRAEQLPVDPPSIVQVTVTDSEIQLKIKAATTRRLTVYSSNNLTLWEPQATLEPSIGLTEFTASRTAEQRFYRAASTTP